MLSCVALAPSRYHCNVDIGESAVKWKTIKELGIDMEKIASEPPEVTITWSVVSPS